MELRGENKAQTSFCDSRKFRNSYLSSSLGGLYVHNLYVVEQRSFDVCDLFVIACISSNKIFSGDL
jgi:hypothetical protein